MAMEIADNQNYAESYVNRGANTAERAGRTGCGRTADGSARESTVTTSTVQLKTAVPGVTKTAQIKTGFASVREYSRYLQGRYSYMNTGTKSMQGIPTTVAVSDAFLKQCMNDPEKAKYLEENLAVIPDCVKKAVAGCQGTLTNLSFYIDEDGSITTAASGTNDPDGKIARENAQRKAKEKKQQEEKQAVRREKKKAEEEKAVERRAERNAERKGQTDQAETDTETFTVSVSGRDAKSMIQLLITDFSGVPAATGAGFDLQA